MSLLTTIYKFIKPELTDSPPDITVMNENWDALDAELKRQDDAHLAHKAEDASTTTKGHAQLNDTVTSTSTTEAATANAVKTAYDKGNHSHPYAPSTHTHTKSQVGLANVENYRQARSAQGYTIQKDGTDGAGIINFKTS